ncbi:MAG: DUF1003 domain-containing protein [Chitinophagaceae bacterium]
MSFKNANELYRAGLKKSDRMGLWITSRVGTVGFFLIIFFWTMTWLGWNMFAPKHFRFDPYPGFVLWLFISNMIQIFLMPLIMIGQNLQDKRAQVRGENDYRVNIKAEKEIKELKQDLIEIKAMLEKIQKNLGN